ncbi:unnamed protein product [Orchesella dallaii]|uniref:Endothelin-converting enzyme 1 n=1 Tax=Orchesella dallaii TaxID=48710 RepID=A0ABP1PWH8_9HEXA
MKWDLKKLGIFVPLLVFCFIGLTSSKRHSRKTEGNFAEWQKRYLEKIQLLAREGGLEEEYWKGITKFDKDVCYTLDCLKSALEFMTATNFTVEPCNHDTWLDFVCARRVHGPDNINQPERLMKLTNLQTQKILNGKSSARQDEFLLKEAQTYYYQCRNKALQDKKDVKTVLDFLSQNYGDWPILTNRDPGEKFKWAEMVADLNKIERYGFKPLIFQVQMPNEGEGSHIKLGMGQAYFLTSGADYDSFFRRVQRYAEIKKPYRSAMLRNMLEFLSNINAASVGLSVEEKITVEKLQQASDASFKKKNLAKESNINWLQFFQRVFNGSDIEISPETVVSLRLNNVINVLQRIWLNDEKAIANALNFQFATVLLQESTVLLDDLNTFKCTEEPGSREGICLERTKELFGYSLGKTYLKVYYDEAKSTPAIEELMSKIQQGYIDVIDENEWMQDKTKEYLKDKIRHMKTYITQPDWLKKRNSLKRFYGQLNASSNAESSYPLNFLAINNWSVGKKRSHAHKIAQMTSFKDAKDYTIYDVEWSRYLGTVQAQFHKGINEARIEGGIVQAPLFNANAPGFMNFGGLGMVLAHEIGHSFDRLGRQYNKDGEKGEFWDKVSQQKYKEWVLKIADDYGKEAHQTSETSAETINPAQTIDEDISDILGVYISYHSYQEYLKELEAEGKHEKVLPGLQKFKPSQLFYMKYANMWCDNKDIQDKYRDMLSDHSSGNTRATLPLRRSVQFAETFGCDLPAST